MKNQKKKKKKRRSKKSALPILIVSIALVFFSLITSIVLISINKHKANIENSISTKAYENSQNKSSDSIDDSSEKNAEKKASHSTETSSNNIEETVRVTEPRKLVEKEKNYSKTSKDTIPEGLVVGEGMHESAKQVVDKKPSISQKQLEDIQKKLLEAVDSNELVDINPTKDYNKSRGTLIFVIDDAGHNTWQLEPFLNIQYPITIAVLPSLIHTQDCVTMINNANKEMILHQPMEAINKLDPGPGAIYSTMSDEEIHSVIQKNLEQVHGAVGINNHMGSKGTSDERIMKIVLEETSRRNIYFLDSMTTGNSVVESVARNMQQSVWERAVFLDNMSDKDSIVHYIEEGKKIAEKHGYAIMIGHVWSAELAQTLRDMFPQLVEQGFSLSSIYRIMMGDYENIRN